MGTRPILVGALCAVLLLGGCAQKGSGLGAEPGDSMSATPSSPGESPSGLPSGLSLPPSPSGKLSGPLTVTGQVEAGVEHGCLVLRDSGKLYLLLGGDPKVVYAGARVRVTGRLATDVMSYCMQGTPLQVSEAHPA